MGAKDAFSGYHPLVSLVYFALVLAFTMVVMHPLSLMISWLGGLTYAACLYGWRAVAAKLRGLFPMLVTAAIVNPAFQHRGVTVLAYFSLRESPGLWRASSTGSARRGCWRRPLRGFSAARL